MLGFEFQEKRIIGSVAISQGQHIHHAQGAATRHPATETNGFIALQHLLPRRAEGAVVFGEGGEEGRGFLLRQRPQERAFGPKSRARCDGLL